LAASADPEDVELEIGGDILGMVVLSQTCDLSRSASDRPYVEICPLVELSEGKFNAVRAGTSAQFAFLPRLETERLVADLERVMTVRKELLASWTREEGCSSDSERIKFARTIARKRARFAFPTDFSEGLSKLRKSIFKKPPARFKDITEIRVYASDWFGVLVEPTFFFIVEDEADRAALSRMVEEMWGMVDLPAARYQLSVPPFHVLTIDEMDPREYRDSVPLEFEILSF
jgi:hypothetical protein